jgi:hypothetical protein
MTAQQIDTSTLAAIERMRKLAQQRESAEVKATPEQPQTSKIIQLPLWPEPTRGTPNSFLRGALFAAIQGKERRALKGELLACQKGYEIRFTGWQLDQSDLDVWEQAAHLAAKNPLGNVCLFRIKAFLIELDRATGKSDREWLKNSFRRLMAAGIEIKHGGKTYGGSLLEFWHDDNTDTYKLQLNPRIFAMYQDGWTAIDWEIRQKLRRKPLALWLHGWLSSNAENYPIKLETLRQLSGSQTKQLKHFKPAIVRAIEDLKKAGAITAAPIDGDLVSFQRTPTASQQKHIIKKPRNPRQPSRK